MRNFNTLLLTLTLALCFSASACAPESLAEIVGEEPGNSGGSGGSGNSGGGGSSSNPQPEESMTIQISVGSQVFKADIEASETGRAFLAKLPLTLDMSELNGNEKYCYGVSLPHADQYFDTIDAGDLMLYSGSCIVLFYGPAGGYSYTRIGRLHTPDGLANSLAAALGPGSVTVTFAKE